MCIRDRYNDDTVENCEHSDTEYISSLLEKHSVEEVVRKCYGEFAYAITDLQERKVYFGRDSIGKRSLSYILLDDELYITSVSGRCDGFQNCLAGVIYIFDINTKQLTGSVKIHDEPYIVSDQIDNGFQLLEEYKIKLYECLRRSVYQRIVTIHPMHLENGNISILFRLKRPR